MDFPSSFSFDAPLVDPGYTSERVLDPRTTPLMAPRFVRDGERDHWWMQGSAFDEIEDRPHTTIDGIDNGLRH